MIFDCHTHWGMAFQQRDGLNPQPWLSLLDRYHVDRAFVLPHLALVDSGRIQEDHNDMAAVCRASNGRMIPFCTANSNFRDEALAELQRCLDQLGFRGLKFHPWMQGQSPSAPAMDDIAELAGHYNAPILFHDGTPPFSMPSQIALLAMRHPKTQFILGHCGLLEHWREAIAALNAAPNLWGCLCGPHPAALRQLVQKCDTARLLWGSDYGFSLSDAIGYRLNMLDVLDLTDPQRQAILEANPAGLLREASNAD
jgi:predicted TIM-barrel fold metal-dependent hydrolase